MLLLGLLLVIVLMPKTYRIFKDKEDKDQLEIISVDERVDVVSKEVLLVQKARIDLLLSKFK